MSKKKHKKIDWRAAAEALAKADQSRVGSPRAKAEKPVEVPQKIEAKTQEEPPFAPPPAELRRGEVEATSGPNVKREIKKIAWVASLLVVIFIATIILDRTTFLPSVLAGKVMVFLHLEQK